MKSLGSAIRQVRTEPREEFGKAPKLGKGLQNLAEVANQFKEKSNRALQRVSKAIGSDGRSSGPLKNIRRQIDTLSRGLGRVTIDVKQEALELMSKPAAKAGFGVDVRAGWSAVVKSDLTVVPGEFAVRLVSAAEHKFKEKESNTAREVRNFFNDDIKSFYRFTTRAAAAKEIVCLSKMGIEISPRDIEQRILIAVGDTPGAIVIQVQPDRVVDGYPKFSDEALKANLAAAHRLNADAREKNIDRSITFVLPPQYGEVLERLQAFNRTSIGE